MKARYEGLCPVCNEAIEPGDEIRQTTVCREFDPGDFKPPRAAWCHIACADKTASATFSWLLESHMAGYNAWLGQEQEADDGR